MKRMITKKMRDSFNYPTLNKDTKQRILILLRTVK